MIAKFFSRIFYRIWQFKQVLLPKLDEKQWESAISQLGEPLRAQLQKLNKSEKAHIQRVYRAIVADPELNEMTRKELLQLALLHDIGKSITRHSVIFKVLKVIFPIANSQHCIAGARFLKRNHIDRRLILRVLRHHCQTADELLQQFQRFDDQL